MDSIGHPVSGVSFRIIGTEGIEVTPGKIGELTAAGPNIMQGYWKDPEETKRVLNGPWYQTGDLAFQDEEGFFILLVDKMVN
jgi:long-chain acyl-CoA synthetase